MFYLEGAPHQPYTVGVSPAPQTPVFTEWSFIYHGKKLEWLFADSGGKTVAKDLAGVISLRREKRGRSVLEWARMHILIGHVN